jgi:calcium/proton exchanger cax
LPLWQRLPGWRFKPCQQIASGFDGAVSIAVMAYALLLFIPLSLALRYIFDAPAGWVFLTGAAAIAVLADWLRRATDQLAERAGSTIGGLLNISFGNTAELILALFVLSRVNTRIVQAQITGSIIGTTLLFFGISALVGGLGRVRQTFSQASAGLLSTLLFVVVVAILLPAIFDLAERIAAPGMNTSLTDERLSLGVSVVLLLLYAANLIYTLVTHRDMFAGDASSGQAEWSTARALVGPEPTRRLLVGRRLCADFGRSRDRDRAARFDPHRTFPDFCTKAIPSLLSAWSYCLSPSRSWSLFHSSSAA